MDGSQVRMKPYRGYIACLIAVLLAAAACGQTAAPAAKDPLERLTPQSSVFHFLEACHSRDYTKASHYLDMKNLTAADRSRNGPDLARQLEDLLDDTGFDIATLSNDPEGDRSDGLSSDLEHLDTFRVDGETLDLQLERVPRQSGLRVWLVSPDSLELIPKAHKLVDETPLEKKLPQVLVTTEFLDTPIWRWILLVLAGVVLWYGGGAVSQALARSVRPLINAAGFRDPVRTMLAVVGLQAVLQFAPPSALPRLFLERAFAMILSLAVAWTAAVAVDIFAARWHSRLDPRVQAVSFSVLPLGRQVLKLGLFLIAILSVVSAWGYDTSTILAGLGVGGLAVALAAQKTIENLFGGISVIGDRPVLVGDVCRFGDRIGTVMHIGLRSTRIRTPDRTIICVPNAQFSAMTLENISRRDKILFNPKLNLRRDTTPEQLQQVLSSIRKILAETPKAELGNLPVRFINVGSYSLDVEVAGYITTADFDEFLEIQQALLIKMLQAVQQAGTALAVPLQETVASGPA